MGGEEITAAELLTGGGFWWKSGRCSGRGCGWRPRKGPWRREGTAAGAWADRGSMGQHRCGGAGSSVPAEQGGCGVALEPGSGTRGRLRRGEMGVEGEGRGL